MERDELIKGISVGSAFLQRPDIREDQKRAAEHKIARYREQLRELDMKAENPYSQENVEKAGENIAKIRTILAGANPQRKIRR